MLPFARNESTRFISSTKTPEYLAAGKPVVSTSIRDVVRPYGQQSMVRIADTVTDFIAAAKAAMREDTLTSGWLSRVDAFLEKISWDRTLTSMQKLIGEAIADTHSSTYSSTTQFPGYGQSPGVVTRDFVFDYLNCGGRFFWQCDCRATGKNR